MKPAQECTGPQGRARGLYDEQLQRQQQEKLLQRPARKGLSIEIPADERVADPA